MKIFEIYNDIDVFNNVVIKSDIRMTLFSHSLSK